MDQTPIANRDLLNSVSLNHHDLDSRGLIVRKRDETEPRGDMYLRQETCMCLPLSSLFICSIFFLFFCSIVVQLWNQRLLLCFFLSAITSRYDYYISNVTPVVPSQMNLYIWLNRLCFFAKLRNSTIWRLTPENNAPFDLCGYYSIYSIFILQALNHFQDFFC